MKNRTLTIKNKLPFAPTLVRGSIRRHRALKSVPRSPRRYSLKKLSKTATPNSCRSAALQNDQPRPVAPGKTVINGKTVACQCQHRSGLGHHPVGKASPIAVIDDGVEIDHPEFAGRIVHPFDATTNDQDPRPKDKGDNHGTACAGMARAAGLKRPAPPALLREASLMPSSAQSAWAAWPKQMPSPGPSTMAPTPFLFLGPHRRRMVEPRPCCSHNRMTGLPDSTRLALEYALNKGRKGKGCATPFRCRQSGMKTRPTTATRSHPGAIAVAACNDTGARSVYSDFGDAVWVCFPSGDSAGNPSNTRRPSARVSARWTASTKAVTRIQLHRHLRGHFRGLPGHGRNCRTDVAANPNLSTREVKDLLRFSCTAIDQATGEYDSNGHSIYYGHGRIDAGLAVENALKTKVQADGPQIEGSIKFSPGGRNSPASWSVDRQFSACPQDRRHVAAPEISPERSELCYRTNVSGLGIVQSKKEGEYVGGDSKKRLLGFAAELEGSCCVAVDTDEIEYSVRLKGLATPASRENGAICGTEKKTGKTIEAISIVLRKK